MIRTDHIFNGATDKELTDEELDENIETLKDNLRCLGYEQKTDKYLDTIHYTLRVADYRKARMVENYTFHGGCYEGSCPNCKNFVSDEQKFCCECGQKLDWNFAKLRNLLKEKLHD